MHRNFPSQVILEPDEVWYINRASLALRLHKLPAEIDAAPASDIDQLLEVLWADSQK